MAPQCHTKFVQNTCLSHWMAVFAMTSRFSVTIDEHNMKSLKPDMISAETRVALLDGPFITPFIKRFCEGYETGCVKLR